MAERTAAALVPRSFRGRVALIALVGLAWRVTYVLVWRRHVALWGDAYFYHESANLIATGHGFIDPYDFNFAHVARQAADHPPLYLLYLATFSFLGFTGVTEHLLASCLLGAVSIAVTGYAGRAVAGARTGLIAAVLVAAYPNIWSNDAMMLSETVAILFVSIMIWLAYTYWRRPSWKAAAGLGAAVALCALSRSELLALSVLVVLPLTLLARSLTTRSRVGHLALAAVTCVGTLAPWVAFNMSRFEKPVYLSAGFEITLATATCDRTYYGDGTGYWNINCAIDILNRHGLNFQNADQSQRSAAYLHDSLDYIRTHLGRLPAVVAARIGRITGLYRPLQQAGFDVFPEGRDRWVAYSGMLSFCAIAVGAAFGVVSLRRRRIPVFPLLGPPITVLFAVVVTFATNRYRASAEGALCILAAVAVDAALGFFERVRTGAGDQVPTEDQAEDQAEAVTASARG